MKNLNKYVFYNVLEFQNMKLDQFGRTLCLRVQGVPFAENESLDDDVDKVKSLITEYGCEIPDVANGRAH